MSAAAWVAAAFLLVAAVLAVVLPLVLVKDDKDDDSTLSTATCSDPAAWNYRKSGDCFYTICWNGASNTGYPSASTSDKMVTVDYVSKAADCVKECRKQAPQGAEIFQYGYSAEYKTCKCPIGRPIPALFTPC